MSSSARILVTGGAGFLGSALVHALNQRGIDDIVVTDQLGTSDKWQNLRALRFRDYVEGDDFMTRIQAGPRTFGSFTAILHMGANSSTTEQNARHLIHANFEYTKQLCQIALRSGARFVYASSAATYGDGSAGMADGDSLEELSKLRPLNMYGYSKHLFDLWARREGVLPQIAGLKFYNVYGPNEGHKGDMRSMVAKAYDQIRAGSRVKLFESHRPDVRHGEQKRDFVYVKDAAAAVLHLALDRTDAGGLFNVGSGKAESWLALVSAVHAALCIAPDIEFIEMPEVLRDKYQYYTCADISKLRATGFAGPAATMQESVFDYVTNYLSPGLRLGDSPGGA